MRCRDITKGHFIAADWGPGRRVRVLELNPGCYDRWVASAGAGCNTDCSIWKTCAERERKVRAVGQQAVVS